MVSKGLELGPIPHRRHPIRVGIFITN
jgi:hypothetical protein